MKRQHSAFTLVELLIVISIIGVLVGLLFPAISGAIVSMAEIECQNNLSQLAKVVRAYCEEHRGSFPMYATTQVRASASNWLYGLNTARQADFSTGILARHKYIGSEEILYCPLDRNRGLARNPQTAVTRKKTVCDYCGASLTGSATVCPVCKRRVEEPNKPPTSYVINASITYGGGIDRNNADAQLWSNDVISGVRSRNISDFDPVDFLFIEQSSGVKPEPNSAFDTGYMTPNSGKYALTNRHRGGGFVSCMDGHVEWFSHEQFKQGMKKVYTGRDSWWREAIKGTKPEEQIGSRWNPG